MGEERCMYKGDCVCKRLDFKKGDYFCTLPRKEGCKGSPTTKGFKKP